MQIDTTFLPIKHIHKVQIPYRNVHYNNYHANIYRKDTGEQHYVGVNLTQAEMPGQGRCHYRSFIYSLSNISSYLANSPDHI